MIDDMNSNLEKYFDLPCRSGNYNSFGKTSSLKNSSSFISTKPNNVSSKNRYCNIAKTMHTIYTPLPGEGAPVSGGIMLPAWDADDYGIHFWNSRVHTKDLYVESGCQSISDHNLVLKNFRTQTFEWQGLITKKLYNVMNENSRKYGKWGDNAQIEEFLNQPTLVKFL